MSAPGPSAILLAAGESRRMGKANKLAVPIDGVPLLRRSALVLLAAALDEIVVVLGHEAETARAMLLDLPLRLIVNPRCRAGRMTSVHLGMQALRRPGRAVMICLADQPLLSSGDIDALIHAYCHECPSPILVPYRDGQRGNPVIVSAAERETLLASGGALTCRRLIDDHPELVWHYPAANDHYCVDLDTVADHERLLARLGDGPAP